MNLKIEEMITQINNDSITQEHELQVLAEVRKTKIKTQNTKELDDKIHFAGKVVLNNKGKELSFGIQDNRSKEKITNKEKDEPEHINTNHLKAEEKGDNSKINPTDLFKDIPKEFKDPLTSDPQTNTIEQQKKGDNEPKDKDQNKSKDEEEGLDISFRSAKLSAINFLDAKEIDLNRKESLASHINQEFLPVNSSKLIPKEQEENSKELENRISTNKSGKLYKFKFYTRTKP